MTEMGTMEAKILQLKARWKANKVYEARMKKWLEGRGGS